MADDDSAEQDEQMQVQPQLSQAIDDQEEQKGPSASKARGKRATPRKIPDDEVYSYKSPMGKSSIRTRQANAATAKLNQLSLN